MKALIKTILFVLGMIFLILIHLEVSFLFPYPLNKLNIIAAFIVLFMLIRETGIIIWIALAAHMFLELYAVTPFGTIIFPAVLATLVTYWIHRDVLTNRSWYTAPILTSILLVLFRCGYIMLVTIERVISTSNPSINYKNLIITITWELLWTSMLVTLAYSLASLFIKRLHTKTIYS